MSDQASGKAEHGVAEEAAKPAQQCHAGSDGDCFWPECPQEANNRANYQVECPLRSHDEGENDDGESLVKHEVTSSAHFPRITKHDLEVVVEAMDKLRAALRVEEEAKPETTDTSEILQYDAMPKAAYTAPPSVDGLEAQCRILIDEMWVRYNPVLATKRLGAFIRTRDRELVENLEGLAAKWEKENSLRSDDSYRYPQQLRAVLAARNEGGTK